MACTLSGVRLLKSRICTHGTKERTAVYVSGCQGIFRASFEKKRKEIVVTTRQGQPCDPSGPTEHHGLRFADFFRKIAGFLHLLSCEPVSHLAATPLIRRSGGHLDPAVLVRLLTAGGAESLGLDDLGTLAPGKAAALAFAPAATEPPDPYAHLLSGTASLETVELG